MKKSELLNSQEFTCKELKVIDYLFDALSPYFGELYSDIDVKDIAKGLKISISSAKGIVGSLVKKKILDTWDTLTGYDVINFVEQEELEND